MKLQAVNCKGGMDLGASSIDIKRGRVVLGFNYELTEKGYRRIDGYERYDGQPAPSSEADNADKEIARALIQPVPGSGKVRGVHVYGGVVYAFRDNVGATASIMYKSTASGWAAVAGVPALSPGGAYECMTKNFSATVASEKMYGVDGVNKCFEFDGTTFTQIASGNTPDAPEHIGSHTNRLVVSQGSIFQMATASAPTDLTGVGAWTKGMGDSVTALQMLQRGVMAVWGSNSINLLYGATAADFEFKEYSSTAGARAGTVQRVGDTFFLDDRGINSFEATQTFADFDAAVVSELIDEYVQSRTNLAIGSIAARKKNQYRLYFSNGEPDRTDFATMTVRRGRVEGFCVGQYPFKVSCTANGDIDGKERMFVGGEDGYVYEIDSGTNFDGAAVEAVLRFPFEHANSPSVRKRWRRVEARISAGSEFSMRLQPEYDFGSPDIPSGLSVDDTLNGGGGLWGISNWDEFNWDSPLSGRLRSKISGTSNSVALVLYSNLTYEKPYTVETLIYHYDIRRAER